jgi:hypothetical protein
VTATKRLLALAAFGALIAAAIVTARQPLPRTHADNKCPVGCVETDLSTLNPPGGMTYITQQTRGPWIVGKPPTSGLQTPSTTQTLNRHPPGGRP